MLKLGRRLHKETPYAGVPIDIQACGQTLGQCVSSAFGIALVAEHDGEITGLMMGAAVPLWFSRKRYVTDFITYAETPGDGLRMIRQFVQWAWSIPMVVEITLAQSSGIDIERAGLIYERLGLKRVGSLYTATRPAVAVEEAA